MIQRIQRLYSELKRDILREEKRSKQPQIYIEKSRPANIVPARVAEALRLAGRDIHWRIRSGVEITVERRIYTGRRRAFQSVTEGEDFIFDLIGHLSAAKRIQVSGISLNHIERRTTRQTQDAINLKSAEIQLATPSVSQRWFFPKGRS